MDALATMAVFALQPPYEKETAPIIAEATVPSLRGLMAKAAAFLNSGGQDLASDRRGEEAQIAIDRILGHAAQRSEG